jgi:hypothetical protein
MPTTQTVLFPPPLRAANTIQDIQNWLFSIQNLHPLRLADTTAGSYSEAVPPAGLNSATGQSNQNQQILYIKTSADANSFALTGCANGTQTLTAQFSALLIKSDGTSWWAVPLNSAGGGGSSAVWGAITGNIASQSDLQAEFASQLATAEAYTDSKVPHFADGVQSSGLVNGVNKTYGLSPDPSPQDSLILVVDDLTLVRDLGFGGDYILQFSNPTQIVLNDPPQRQIRAWYRY